ncbi:hypothetical protein EV193_112169 [Herbihabitans rhizosphaerae]|uniref:Uncharacterized protein n=1 Tax=Herbihabitans rhizosphaerae TaxID=1872711 RepID=A0A4Q7KE68_9PSEU|nr:ABC transporter permease [Herbihabitans rhizosphaerae]RZS32535.1 hypothetical protein EV193_112169 [Herbihabitans rhizosphaerae]
MATSNTPRPVVVAVLLSVAGALVAALIGLLTFGAQATASPDHVPLAVATPSEGPAAAPLRAAAERLTAQGGDAVGWRVVTGGEGRKLLADKEVYGVLELVAEPTGELRPTVVLSGAVNPSATQIAQPALTGAAQGIAAAAPRLAPGVTVAPAQTITLHPASAAGRTAPLGGTALLWLAGLVATLGSTVLITRAGKRVGIGSRLTVLVGVSVLGVAVVAGLLSWWDSSLPLNPEVIGFLLLTAVAFAAVQGGLVRLLGIRAAAILGPLYLVAPAVAGQVPELLNPAYRAVLWSWTPFRFSAEGLRSLLQGTPDAPDVRTGVIVLGAMAVGGLLVMLIPGRRSAGEVAQSHTPNGVVDVGVDEADRLPGAQGEAAVEDRNTGVGRHERR